MCFGKIWNWFKETFGVTEEGIEPYLPIDSAEKLKLFIKDMGVSIDENDLFIATIPYDTERDEFGFVGSKAKTVIDGAKKIVGYVSIVECRTVLERDGNGRIVTAVTKFSLEFDPNNGWIRKFYYNKNLIDLDVPQIKRRLSSDNPDYENYLKLI